MAAGIAGAHNSAMKFASSSKLAVGRWVKVGIGGSGVYEISHSTLKAMGFDDPEKVGVYGRGGRQLNMNFFDATGKQLYNDDLEPIGVLHKDGKLYFYGVGPQEFRVNHTAGEMSGWYERTNRNIYSDMGYYFLSDAVQPEPIQVAQVPDSKENTAEITMAYGMVNHEIDLFQNNTDSGQLFYGEPINPANPRMEWHLKLPGAIAEGKALMECMFYFDKDIDCTWSYGFTTDKDPQIYSGRKINSSSIRSLTPMTQTLNLPGDEVSVFVEVNTADPKPVVSNLDYWTLTYQRNIPDLTGTDGEHLNQEEVAFPQLISGNGRIRIPNGANYLALDVSNPTEPTQLTVEPEGNDGIITLRASSNIPRIAIFDPLQPQLQIKGFQTGYTQIANQNLHSRAAEGADLVIICLPQLVDTARRLALLHKAYDGSNTLIATTEECYNEFSAGVPDPMAYRALVKATYSSSLPCRNLLLLGPLYSDFRGVVSMKHPDEGIIAYQCHTLTQTRGAQNANDILGMMADYIDLRELHINDMQVGIGLLPVRYEAEAEVIVNKIEEYMKGTNVEFYLNTFTQIGGIGDNHTHDKQAINLSNLIDRLSDYGTISTNLPVDAYGEMPAQNKLFNDFNEGRLTVNYFGHGAATQLNQTGRFFTAGDIYRLRNKYLPFMAFAGCSLTNTDRGVRGIGESIVLSTPYGAIGSLVATRETWSAENALFFETFYINLFRDGTTATAPAHKRALTIGEAFARSKTQSSNNNELAYQIIGDPALVLPVTTRRVYFTESSPEFNIGERITIHGYVADETGSGEIDPTFNGKIVARLMEPARTFISEDLCTEDSDPLRVPVADIPLGIATGEVIDGQFSIDIFIPVSAKDFINQPSNLHIAAYSPEIHTAGGGLLTGILTQANKESTGERDHQPPVIEYFDFDPDNVELRLRVSDDVALGYSTNPLHPSFRLIVDGKENTMGTHVTPIPDMDGIAYEKSVPLPHISNGTHTAKVTVADAAGNTATSEITFTYTTSDPVMGIRLNENAIYDEGHILLETTLHGTTELVIMDSNGETIRRTPFYADGFVWDACDETGTRVAPGLYRAYIIQTEGSKHKAHSATIDLPVVGQ